MERFSPKRLGAEGLWGGLLYWRPWKMCQERLRIRAALYIRGPITPEGNLESGGVGARILGALDDE